MFSWRTHDSVKPKKSPRTNIPIKGPPAVPKIDSEISTSEAPMSTNDNPMHNNPKSNAEKTKEARFTANKVKSIVRSQRIWTMQTRRNLTLTQSFWNPGASAVSDGQSYHLKGWLEKILEENRRQWVHGRRHCAEKDNNGNFTQVLHVCKSQNFATVKTAPNLETSGKQQTRQLRKALVGHASHQLRSSWK